MRLETTFDLFWWFLFLVLFALFDPRITLLHAFFYATSTHPQPVKMAAFTVNMSLASKAVKAPKVRSGFS